MNQAADVSLIVPAVPDSIAVIRQTVSGICEALGADTRAVGDIKLAATEACTNVVLHAYANGDAGTIEVDAYAAEDELRLLVRDQQYVLYETRQKNLARRAAHAAPPPPRAGWHAPRPGGGYQDLRTRARLPPARLRDLRAVCGITVTSITVMAHAARTGGFASITVDLTPRAPFAAERLAAARRVNRAGYARVHGDGAYAAQERFYTVIARLYDSGSLGAQLIAPHITPPAMVTRLAQKPDDLSQRSIAVTVSRVLPTEAVDIGG